MNLGLKEKVLELYGKGMSYNKIAELLKCSKGTVSYHCRKNNLGTEYRAFTEAEKTKILELYISNRMSNKHISVEMSASLYIVKTVTANVKRDKITKSSAVINWRKRVKLKLIAFFGGKCKLCAYDRHEGALQFHHLDPSQKDFQIGGKSNSYEKLLEEAKKCILLCSNCHSEVHAGIRVIE
jgi:predicted transcriptional regulator